MFKLYPLKLYFKHKSTYIPLSVALFLNLCIWAWLIFNIGFSTESVFLHYNILFGVDLTGSAYKVYALPGLGLFLILFNAAIGWVMYEKDEFVAQAGNVLSCIVHIFLFVATSILVFLNV
ncbi:MAG: hypothetical protein A3B90_02725 [Candidatus Magasanikbacteria bacterium RIFCSPHIGHO2_02_FULL_41_13]|uniref:DUF5658 domain-containing protein n=1 Tax=Candidatus Magasanikbacteria bacterium RIFCSPHIGHO2_02_FULL_41_13 TaxID=1798676 RepID=A0A1F6M515_9BACT|nr:MAG: hypothetical protein A3B90_02725 [Candidatus Magasanikbacteria bacterium RIFCSPHIGHO2_02_FULL_41_13]